jgi:hypothetical protein
VRSSRSLADVTNVEGRRPRGVVDARQLRPVRAVRPRQADLLPPVARQALPAVHQRRGRGHQEGVPVRQPRRLLRGDRREGHPGGAKIPDDVPLTSASLIGCGVLTGVGAVFNRAKVPTASRSWSSASAASASTRSRERRSPTRLPVIAVDTNPGKEAFAKAFGATHFICPDGPDFDLVAAVKEICPNGVDYVFECVGSTPLIKTSTDLLDWGGTLVMLGVPKMGSEASFVVNTMYNDKTIMGCRYGSARPQYDIPLMVQAVPGRVASSSTSWCRRPTRSRTSSWRSTSCTRASWPAACSRSPERWTLARRGPSWRRRSRTGVDGATTTSSAAATSAHRRGARRGAAWGADGSSASRSPVDLREDGIQIGQPAGRFNPILTFTSLNERDSSRRVSGRAPTTGDDVDVRGDPHRRPQPHQLRRPAVRRSPDRHDRRPRARRGVGQSGSPQIVTRGILLDIARRLGVDRVDPGSRGHCRRPRRGPRRDRPHRRAGRRHLRPHRGYRLVPRR